MTNINIIIDWIFQNYFFSSFVLFSIFSYIRFIGVGNNRFLTALFIFPTTIIHEFLHFIFGLILFAKPTGFSLFPKFENGKIVLGNVTFKNINFFNAIPIAFAPTLLFFILYYIDTFIFPMAIEYKNIFYFILIIYINSIGMYSAIPSGQDFKVAFSNILGIFFYLILFTTLIFFYKGIA